MKKIIQVLVFLSVVVNANVFAANQDARDTTILRMTSYVTFGNGDIVILPTVTAPNCDSGFWLSPDDPGFSSTLSVLLSAYHAKSNISLGGDDQQLWAGSSSKFCRLIYAELKE